jgi:CTP-dependent riboflavin kinase
MRKKGDSYLGTRTKGASAEAEFILSQVVQQRVNDIMLHRGAGASKRLLLLLLTMKATEFGEIRVTRNELAEKIGVTGSTASRAIQILVKHGFFYWEVRRDGKGCFLMFNPEYVFFRPQRRWSAFKGETLAFAVEQGLGKGRWIDTQNYSECQERYFKLGGEPLKYSKI